LSLNHPSIISRGPQGPRGRCLSADARSVRLRTPAGIVTVEAPGGPRPAPGDWVEVRDGSVTIATRGRTAGATPLADRVLDPRRLRGAAARAKVEAAVRAFFLGRGFLETPTPLLVPCPGMEPHIRPYRAVPAAAGPAGPGEGAGAYLPTSPEFALKRLLVGGLERVFQLCPAFRDEPFSPHHRPEFTMLEWYRAFAGLDEILADTEELVAHLAREVLGCAAGEERMRFQGREIRVDTPWPRLRVRDLFAEHAGVDLARASPDPVDDLRAACARLGLGRGAPEDTWDDLYFRIWLNAIEPRLPADRAVFVTRYPESQAALSVVTPDPDGTRWAQRFEAYAGGLELCNAFEELTDPDEQRRRFVEDMELRARQYGDAFPKTPLDEGFLAALAEGMPPAGGNAVGLDRLVMLVADEADIGFTRWLDPWAPISDNQA
jgi:elongation factor P--(R)-beta-lysine ligase